MKRIIVVCFSFLISLCFLPTVSIAEESHLMKNAASLLDEQDMADSAEQMFEDDYEDEVIDESDEIY